MEDYDPVKIAEDLGICRHRGLDWLDRNRGHQEPVQVDSLERLAADYVIAQHRVDPGGRIGRIKALLRDGIEEFGRQGHTADAVLLRDLFFGELISGPIQPPGILLKNAQKRVGDTTESRFRERRSGVMNSFASFLIAFATAGMPDRDQAASRDVPQAREQSAVTGFVGDNEHFVELLAEADNVTIVGITNERLMPILKDALDRKRARGSTDAFWSQLRIVFLRMDQLKSVDDERETILDSDEALRLRRSEATWARRSIGVFLKRTQSSRWELFEYPYMPVLIGTLFEFADSRKKVQLLVRRPRRPTSDHIYIDLDDTANQFSHVFEDIVHTSQSDNMIVPVGVPAANEFVYRERRMQSKALKDGSNAAGWLPMVLVVTYRHRLGRIEPVLQLRTVENSAREENRLSHLGGHIVREDLTKPGGLQPHGEPGSFDLNHQVPFCAAERLVREVTGVAPGNALIPMQTGGYLYPDKEHLFFFIFALELPDGTQFPRRAEMHQYALSDLLAIRDDQVLRSVISLCRAPGLSDRAWSAATEILALNLTLHDRADLGHDLRAITSHQRTRRQEMADLAAGLMSHRTASSWAYPVREVQLEGLAGWQFREFFSALLPIYAHLGIAGAADLNDMVSADDAKSAARDQLAELYQDEHLMAPIPLEL